SEFYTNGNANIHRGVYDLSNQASIAYEHAREKVAKFLGAKPENIAFTSGTSESMNIIARSYLSHQLKKGDNVVVSILEHHSNFIPWQQLAKEKEAEFRIAPIDQDGNLNMKALNGLLDSKTKMLAINHVSNTLGTVNDLQQITDLAHQKGIPVAIDAAQGAAFHELDQSSIGYDFLGFSGHKVFGPFGTGVLFVSNDYRDQIKPFNFGGGMILDVREDDTDFATFPRILEAGTSNIGGVIGLSAAIDFLNELDRGEARNHILELGEYCRVQLAKIEGVRVIGNPKERTAIVPFSIDNIHPHDVSSFLNRDGVAVRAGMHCTQPLLQHLGVPATVRASFSIYNTKEEIDRMMASLRELIKFWS
ncbi:MAG: cysteine desulfurase, partial [Cyclobacteriaceae bacterium]